MFEKLLTRYNKGYIREDQLKRYLELNVITDEEYLKILENKTNNDENV